MKRRLHLPSAHRHGRSPSIHRSCSKRERAESLWSLSHRVSSFPFVSTGLRDRNLYAPFVPPRCRFNEGTGSGISAPRSTTLHLPRSSERDQVFLHDKHNFSLSLSFFFSISVSHVSKFRDRLSFFLFVLLFLRKWKSFLCRFDLSNEYNRACFAIASIEFLGLKV